jgi:hypothetical protein
MALELRVRVKNAVCGGVVSRRVHGIGTSLVEGSLVKLCQIRCSRTHPVYIL